MQWAADSGEREQDLYQTNLAAFKTWAPHLYGRLAGLEKPNSQLVVDPEGRVDMNFRGQGFYEGDAVAYTSAQLERYFEKPLRHAIGEPSEASLLGAAGRFCTSVKAGMAELGVVFDPDRAAIRSDILVVYGLGLGLHVDALIDRTDARVVVLIEPHLEFLHHSLFVNDWCGLFARAAEADRKIAFIVESDSRSIAMCGRAALRTDNPALLDGIYLYTHYPSTVLERAKDRMRHELFLALTGLGFFEDEVSMTRNAVSNLSRAPADILSAPHPARTEPLFIVGSGPSVEQDLEAIAAHAGRAVILSIGTALRVLLNRGIRPDFHVELERSEGPAEILTATAQDHDLGGITLIASATVDPAAVAMFERRILFFRETVSPTRLFGGPFDLIKPAGPTVANAALICAMRLGFRELYLFGLDMGSKVEGRYHATSSIYGIGARPDPAKPSTLSYAGNFGGEATGITTFTWSRKMLESMLQLHPSLRVYNCSDGVRIDGAIPKVSRALTLPGPAIDRDALTGSLNRHVARHTPDLLRQMWRQRDRHGDADETLGRIESLIEAAAGESEPGMSWMHELFEIVRPSDGSQTSALSYLVGTVTLLIGCTNWYDRRIADEQQRFQFRRMALAELRGVVSRLRRELGELFADLDRMTDAGAHLQDGARPVERTAGRAVSVMEHAP